MKNIRLVIVVNSLVLAAWLGASFVTEVSISTDQQQAAKPALSDAVKATVKASSESLKTPLPVAHMK
ncbi:hypothetical protein JIN77_09850 [Verrucomicrobiaceae bacterium R5-34]|uniref:Uncharacterized protein n=1 Tax=Oceaniferula flava TaxID=2800421 RepID=A0AAE2SC94_9BACT|nr:hypothetical protein [Oceaniferula flavus]MBK1831028.1 hypothetical protein [Verrucomicrobiaceae bacterium R5-34]MBK1855545.1 hypothetical protein [Oceaniferula flavus]MBM1136851.1 hypothetical protein [Oceaniferula flavus]